MRRRFHIVAVTPNLQEALAVQTSAGWLFPCLDDDSRRALPDQTHALLGRIVEWAEMLHEAPFDYDKGTTWIRHAYIVALIGRVTTRLNNVQLHPIANLLSGRPLLPLQRRALIRSHTRLLSPDAPFDSGDRVSAALAWADEQIAGHTGAKSVSMIKHRCARHEYVVACESIGGMMYFKGGRERTADEAALTSLLHALNPQEFPETIAIDSVHDRWLCRGLRGDVLIGSRFTLEATVCAVRALASVQKLAIAASAVSAHLHNRRLNGVELFERVDRIVGDSTDDTLSPLLDRWRAAAGRLTAICGAIDALRLPQTLVFSDFRGRNILRTSTGFGFIDLERSYWSYPFLSLGRLVGEARRYLPEHSDPRAALQQAFIDEWKEVVAPTTMIRALDSLPTLERLFGLLLASTELDLEEREFGEALPAGYRARRLAPYLEACIEAATATAVKTREATAAAVSMHPRREL